jgi:hypothetical protein
MSSPPLFHYETGNVPLPLEDRLLDLARLLKISPFGRNDKNGRYSKLSGGGCNVEHVGTGTAHKHFCF